MTAYSGETYTQREQGVFINKSSRNLPLVFKSTHAHYSTNSGNSVVNPPTLPLGECNLHYLNVSQLKGFYTLQGNNKGMHVRDFSLIFVYLDFCHSNFKCVFNW